MRFRIRQSLGVISLVFACAPIEASDLTVKDRFYAALESVVDQCPRLDTLLVLGDFIASTGTDRDGDETCVAPWTLGGWLMVSAHTDSSLDLVFQCWWFSKGD